MSAQTKKTKKTKEDTFEVGQKAVYPAYGVGVIERIENKEIAGTVLSFYVMRILDSDMTVMIPTEGVTSVGLRKLIQPAKVNKVYKVFQDTDIIIDTTTWNRRQREYNEKLKTGSVFDIAEVIRDLYILKKRKTLSFGERSVLDRARNLLVKELAMVKAVSEDEIEEQIQKHFNK